MPSSIGKGLMMILAAGAAIAGLLTMVIGGMAIYSLLNPPVWTERLPFENSTGQYETIVKYRNATDTTYANLTAFLAEDGTGERAASDPMYRCVEYAVRLQDGAEAVGINCTIVPTQLYGRRPGHALNAFYTLDKGMVYVDLSSMNVSQADFDGVPFDRVLLLRPAWSQTLPFKDTMGRRPAIAECRNATAVSFGALKQFLEDDDTEDATYTDPEYTCLDFAVRLHDAAEAAGIKCGVVTVSFTGETVGHAFNAFPTTDLGIVYIDCTGINQTLQRRGLSPVDSVVFLKSGEELGELAVNQAERLDYDYYLSKRERKDVFLARVDQYLADLELYNADVAAHNQKVDALNADWARYEAEYSSFKAQLDDYNARMTLHNEAVRRYNEGDHSVIIPPAPTGEGALLAWRSRLIDQYSALQARGHALEAESVVLDARGDGLKATRESLINSEEYHWIVKPPFGVVDEAEVIW